ncbi:hypothetical protein [Nocardia neocaledoniensis]|uniref:hypothetical protein n=1 Tax=Nocardia TaxID=1817 RepID=UPI0024572641|nr:hypothetical protein [Nocardia neocaledoniensis]
MRKILAKTALAGVLAISGLVMLGSPAHAQSADEYCVAGGGQVVVRYNDGERYFVCQGGQYDGWILGQPVAR